MFFWEEEDEGVVADYKGIWKNSTLSPTRRLLLLILFGIIHLNVLPNKQLFVSMAYSVDQWTINSRLFSADQPASKAITVPVSDDKT